MYKSIRKELKIETNESRLHASGIFFLNIKTTKT